MTNNFAIFSRLLSSDWGIYVTRAAVLGTNLASMLLIALMLEPSAFGEFVFMFSAALTLSAIVSIGAPALLLRELSAAGDTDPIGISRKQVFGLVVFWPATIIAVLALVFLALQAPISELFAREHSSAARVLLVLMFAGTIHLTNMLAVAFRVQGHIGTAMAIRDAGPQAVMLTGCSIATFVAQPSANLVFTLGAVILFIILVLGVGLLRTTLSNQISRLPREHSHISVVGFWGTAVANMTWTQVDILIGGIFMSPSTLGEYQVIKRIANFANMPQIVANEVVVVRVGRAFAENRYGDIQVYTRNAMRLSALPLLLLSFFLLGFSPLILGWFNITMEPQTWILLIILLLGSTINVLYGVNFAVASQCKLERVALASRLAGLACCATIILVVQPTDPRLVAVAFVCGLLTSNAWLWRQVLVALAVDTSIVSLFKGSQRKL